MVVVLSFLNLLIPVLLYQGVRRRQGRVVTPIHRGWTLVLISYLWLLMMGSAMAPFCTWGGALHHALAAVLTPGIAGVLIHALALLLMVPVGFMVPHIWRNFSSAVEVVFIGYLFALLLELAQLPTHRMVAVDDVALASLGTFLGFLFWRRMGYYFFCGRVSERQVSVGPLEPLVYLVLVGGVGLFFYNWQWLLA